MAIRSHALVLLGLAIAALPGAHAADKRQAASTGASKPAAAAEAPGQWGPMGFHATWIRPDQQPAPVRPKSPAKNPAAKKAPAR